MTHPTQEDDVKALRDALAGVTFWPNGNVSYFPLEWNSRATPERIARLLARLEQAERDAGRYQLLRRGQHWSIIDWIGDILRGEVLDAAIDTQRAAIASEAKP